mmetsp:Transcript_16556/g.51794  ORF Transcript_16556/g.51794 Transcript_16556/m.51794 type:complete len:222 (-) Transcript_16556:863-1528(-)
MSAKIAVASSVGKSRCTTCVTVARGSDDELDCAAVTSRRRRLVRWSASERATRDRSSVPPASTTSRSVDQSLTTCSTACTAEMRLTKAARVVVECSEVDKPSTAAQSTRNCTATGTTTQRRYVCRTLGFGMVAVLESDAESASVVEWARGGKTVPSRGWSQSVMSGSPLAGVSSSGERSPHTDRSTASLASASSHPSTASMVRWSSSLGSAVVSGRAGDSG